MADYEDRPPKGPVLGTVVGLVGRRGQLGIVRPVPLRAHLRVRFRRHEALLAGLAVPALLPLLEPRARQALEQLEAALLGLGGFGCWRRLACLLLPALDRPKTPAV